jgi:ATP-dependent DNA helicase RecG
VYLDIDRIHDNIFKLIDIAEEYAKKNIKWCAEVVDMKRIGIPEVPSDALREIINNSFIHAQYDTKTEREISIYPSKIEIYNPGAFPPQFTPDDFATQIIKSELCNPIIADTLFCSG